MVLRMSLSLVLALICSVYGKLVTIDNTKARLDRNGKIVNAHDGTVRWFEGSWWMHAAEYGECQDPPKHGCQQTPSKCGFGPMHNVSIW